MSSESFDKALSAIKLSGSYEDNSAIGKKLNYAQNVAARIKARAAQQDVEIFTNGEDFKQRIVQIVGQDESVFTKSVDEIMEFDLSQSAVHNALQDTQSPLFAFWGLLEFLYSSSVYSAIFDENQDGTITDKEAKEAIECLRGLDLDYSSLSLDDFACITDSINPIEEENGIQSSISGSFSNAFKTLKTRLAQKVATSDVQSAINERWNNAAKSGTSGKNYNLDADFDEMLGVFLGYEGGYSNHPLDSGGETNYGVTEATYRAYKNDPNADVKNITQEEVYDLYYNLFYVPSGAKDYADSGNTAYAFVLFNMAAAHGVGTAKKLAEGANGDVDKLMEIWKQKFISIVDNNPSQQVFEKGWQNRWNKVYSYIDPTHQYENYIG